jgi:hypothetical protein
MISGKVHGRFGTEQTKLSKLLGVLVKSFKWIIYGRMNKPPDGGWGWVVTAASFFIHFFVLGSQYSFGLLFKV